MPTVYRFLSTFCWIPYRFFWCNGLDGYTYNFVIYRFIKALKMLATLAIASLCVCIVFVNVSFISCISLYQDFHQLYHIMKRFPPYFNVFIFKYHVYSTNSYSLINSYVILIPISSTRRPSL